MADQSRSSLGARLTQIRFAFTQTRQADPRLVPLLLAVGLGVLAVAVLIGVLVGNPVIGAVLGVVLGLLGALLVFGQRTAAVALAAIEGRPGAAAAVLQSLRGWRVTPAVAFTRKQDLVHRAVGRPGVVLIGEGAPARVTALLKQEHRAVARVVGDTPIHELNVGTGEGQIPLGALRAQLVRLPRAIKAAEVAALDTRLAALGGSDLPLPKGPLPPGVRGRRRLG
jgi:hypothetical protein